MANKDKGIVLEKKLGFFALFSIASGAMISSGLFVLPAIAYSQSGPAVIISYILATIFVIPAMLTKVELTTAMPKSGGTYFFVNRSLGPLLGTFAGFANWLSVALKSAFALVGIGIFIQPFIPIDSISAQTQIKIIAIGFTLFFTILNILSVKESGRMQIILVIILISILIVYILLGINKIDTANYTPFFIKDNNLNVILSSAGLIFISFGGLTKISSIASEATNPGKNIPLAMITSFVVVSVLYITVIIITIGTLPGSQLKETLTPISDGAKMFMGKGGWWILSIGALTAFITTANAGLMASSRTPFAMAEDNLIPPIFARISIKFKTPIFALLLTSIFIIISITFLDIEKLAKTASTMMLLLFALDCVSAIIMRSSGIKTYRPLFRAPLFPYLQIIGIIIYLFLIVDMGFLPSAITVAFFVLSIIWYFSYSRTRNKQQSALVHIVQKITNKKIKTNNLADELREILIERDELIEDRFDILIQEADIIDLDTILPPISNRKELFNLIAEHINLKTMVPASTLFDLLNERENESTTIISDGLAIPHLIFEGKNKFCITIVRSKQGIKFDEEKKPVHIIFALAGTKDERNFHLQALMSIAQIVSNKEFMKAWIKARDTNELRNHIRLAERVRKG